MPELKEERSLGELFTQLLQETSTLMRQEVQLARVEMSQKASDMVKDATLLIIGGAVAYAGLLAIVFALIAGLSLFMAAWLAALLVGVVIAAIGYLMIQKGMHDLKHVNPAPEKTIESIKEDTRWVQQQMR